PTVRHTPRRHLIPVDRRTLYRFNERPMYDVDVDSVDHESTYASEPFTGAPMRWPPPGLEVLQGLACRAVALLAIGTGIMIAPMLLSVATRQNFWSTGLFGSSWWVPVVAALIGLLILL